MARTAGRRPPAKRVGTPVAAESVPEVGRSWIRVAAAVAVVVVLAVVWLVSRGGDDTTTSVGAAKTPGVETFTVASREHVQGTVEYPQSPPVGGNHNPVWQNCGFYDAAIPNERGVHSMEHGAAWITYRPDLDAGSVTKLRSLAQEPYTVVSPFDGLGAPVVVSAWGRQLRLDGPDDPRLGQFLTEFREGSETPEPGAPCSGGEGSPQ